MCWSNEPADDGPHLRKEERQALGWSGYLADSADAEKLWKADDVGETADDLAGVFGVFRATQDGFNAVTALVRVDPVYWTRAAGVVLAGNRALLVHLAARAIEEPDNDHPTVRCDVHALQSLVRNGFFLNDDTPFEKVTALPAHSTLIARRGQADVVTRPVPPPATQAAPGWRAGRHQVRGLADALVDAVQPIRGLPGTVELGLTGGRDSRLIASALHAAGIPFRAQSSGFDDHPDVILGSRIAGLLGIQHRTAPPHRNDSGDAVVVRHPLERACHVIRATDGMLSAYENVAAPVPFSQDAKIIGMGGEQLRGGYLISQDELDPVRLRKRVAALFLNVRDLMTDAANERAQADMAPWAQRATTDPVATLDWCYLYYRTGRWAVGGRLAQMVSSACRYPLLDNRLNRRALGISALWRWSEEAVHRTISLLAPQLANVPMAGRRWRYEEGGPPRFRARRSWRARHAMKGIEGTASFNWRRSADPALFGLLREHILDGPPALFDIVRRPQAEKVLAEPSFNSAIFIWQAFTASVLLGKDFLADPPRLPPVSVSIR